MGRKTRKKRISISEFRCPECGRIIPLPRVHRQREFGHIKDLYCPYCQEMKKFSEKRSCDFFEQASL